MLLGTLLGGWGHKHANRGHYRHRHVLMGGAGYDHTGLGTPSTMFEYMMWYAGIGKSEDDIPLEIIPELYRRWVTSLLHFGSNLGIAGFTRHLLFLHPTEKAWCYGPFVDTGVGDIMKVSYKIEDLGEWKQINKYRVASGTASAFGYIKFNVEKLNGVVPTAENIYNFIKERIFHPPKYTDFKSFVSRFPWFQRRACVVYSPLMDRQPSDEQQMRMRYHEHWRIGSFMLEPVIDPLVQYNLLAAQIPVVYNVDGARVATDTDAQDDALLDSSLSRAEQADQRRDLGWARSEDVTVEEWRWPPSNWRTSTPSNKSYRVIAIEKFILDPMYVNDTLTETLSLPELYSAEGIYDEEYALELYKGMPGVPQLGRKNMERYSGYGRSGVIINLSGARKKPTRLLPLSFSDGLYNKSDKLDDLKTQITSLLGQIGRMEVASDSDFIYTRPKQTGFGEDARRVNRLIMIRVPTDDEKEANDLISDVLVIIQSDIIKYWNGGVQIAHYAFIREADLIVDEVRARIPGHERHLLRKEDEEEIKKAMLQQQRRHMRLFKRFKQISEVDATVFAEPGSGTTLSSFHELLGRRLGVMKRAREEGGALLGGNWDYDGSDSDSDSPRPSPTQVVGLGFSLTQEAEESPEHSYSSLESTPDAEEYSHTPGAPRVQRSRRFLGQAVARRLDMDHYKCGPIRPGMWWHPKLVGVLTPPGWQADRAFNQEAHNWETVCFTLLDMGMTWEQIEPKLIRGDRLERVWDTSRIYPLLQ